MPRLRGRQKVLTFSIFFASARRSLRTAKEIEDGSFYESLNSLVMAAFTVEAYLNHLGEILLKDSFKSFEKDSIWKKYKKLRKLCGLPPASIEDVYPVVAQLLNFRNSMAHGRTENNEIDVDTQDRTIPLALSFDVSGWRSVVTPEAAESALNDVKLLVTELNSSSGLGESPFSTSGGGLYSLSADDGKS
ncbi:hypothetical protein [Pseudomonas sp. RC10]|uniref:hypothetical protein n=1 Tax=Pseudomonas bambusae TaxID=3139142 RepID=UPI0031389814